MGDITEGREPIIPERYFLSDRPPAPVEDRTVVSARIIHPQKPRSVLVAVMDDGATVVTPLEDDSMLTPDQVVGHSQHEISEIVSLSSDSFKLKE
jgi:hypothetical protein